MTAGVTGVPIEALATLRRRLAALPGRHPQREALLSSTAELYGDLSPNRRKFRQIKFSAATIASRSITCPLSRKV